ncbi:hypothetical protein SAMN05192575_11350 [Nocardioides alpinus]|uniref:Galactose oxidase, central domain n=1 Tax=Nocardioides alpinus TaxID=748909 RepID=A0A1I1B368_9ACTN|nr:hypothetical protein SAMN05192575_11350 [Nocardioides alpinus]
MLATVATFALACSGPEPEPFTIEWVEQALPAPDGAPGRTVVRDAVGCGDGWWVVGAVFLDRPSETRDTRPAAWFSRDRETWTSVPVETRTYWGRRAILNSVACSRGRIAAVGARSGGAHGNPRVTTFRTDGQALVDVPALFTQYGGVSATNVGPIAGSPTGWLITGNRTSGPGVWFTDDPRAFTRVEAESGLTDDGDLESLAQGAGWSGEEWVVVGSGARTGRHLDPDPLAWTSPDGLTWTPEEMPAADGIQDVHRVTPLDDGRLLAVGRSGTASPRGCATTTAGAGQCPSAPSLRSGAERRTSPRSRRRRPACWPRSAPAAATSSGRPMTVATGSGSSYPSNRRPPATTH